jgi:hemoglobin/transferrin/lactoferrin receptor protein
MIIRVFAGAAILAGASATAIAADAGKGPEESADRSIIATGAQTKGQSLGASGDGKARTRLRTMGRASPRDRVAEPELPEHASEQANAVETITVTATRLPTPVQEAPATVTVIDGERIADELATDVRDLVRFEPGVSVRRAPARFSAAFGSTGREGNAGFNIRGLGGNRVLIQVDGIRVPEGFAFGAQAAGRGDYVDIGLIKSVEILRGPTSALYGSDGLAGAVSFETSDPAGLLGSRRDLTALVRGAYDSASNEFSETALAAGRSAAWSGLIAYTRRDGQELDTKGDVGGSGPTRTLPNPQDTRSNALLGKILFAPDDRHRFRLTGEYSDGFTFTDVLSARTTTVVGLVARDRIERSRISLDWRYDGSGPIDFAQVVLYWQDARNRQFALEDRTVLPDRERLNTFDNRVLGASAEGRAAFSTGAVRHNLAFGGDVSVTRQSGVRDGTVPPVGERFPTAAFPSTDYTLAGLFLADAIELAGGRLTLHPALRFDYYSLDPQQDPRLPNFTAAAQKGSRVTPRVGVVGRLGGGFSLYGNYAQGFKAPSPTQVNQFFENPVFNYTSLPNPDLGPETSETYEAGLRYADPVFVASLTGFVGRYENFISQKLVRGTFRRGDPGVFQFVNLDRVEIGGVEGRAGLNLPGGFNANLAVAWATGEVIDPSGSVSPLPTIDPLKIVAGAGWRDPAGRLGLQLYLTDSTRKALEDTAGVCTGECFRPKAFTLLDATAFWRIGEATTLRAGLFNIADRKYAWWSDVIGLPASAPDRDAYTQPGRNFRASVSFRF